MSQPTSHSNAPEARTGFDAMKLEDFGKLQARYSALGLAHRAGAVLADAKPALVMAEDILAGLGSGGKSRQLFDKLRKNSPLVARMRASDAKSALMDSGNDFLDVTRKKLSAWRKTIERLSLGEGIVVEGNREFISSRDPLCAAMLGIASLSSYLSVVQLAIAEQAKAEPDAATYYQSLATKLRRCATLISDCENAGGLASVVH